MLRRAFGADAVAVRVNAAGQGDFFQVHVDARRAAPDDVKAFLRQAFYRRFGLKPDPEFVEPHPGGGAAGVRLARFEDLDGLVRRLAERAVVYRTADLIAAGFFGAAPVSERFLGRVGNLVVLPYRGEAVWWYEKDRFEQKYFGHHGGHIGRAHAGHRVPGAGAFAIVAGVEDQVVQRHRSNVAPRTRNHSLRSR
jgi:hypothetical protein